MGFADTEAKIDHKNMKNMSTSIPNYTVKGNIRGYLPPSPFAKGIGNINRLSKMDAPISACKAKV